MRIISCLLQRAETVNIYDAGLVLLLLWLGVVLANESPPYARFHDPVGHLTPHIERTVQRWVT